MGKSEMELKDNKGYNIMIEVSNKAIQTGIKKGEYVFSLIDGKENKTNYMICANFPGVISEDEVFNFRMNGMVYMKSFNEKGTHKYDINPGIDPILKFVRLK